MSLSMSPYAAAVPAASSVCLIAWNKSAHFAERQGQRGITDTAALLAVTCGQCFYEHTDRVFFLGRKAIRKHFKHAPAAVAEEWVRRADGLVVVVAENGRLITAYRNPRFLGTLKRRRD